MASPDEHKLTFLRGSGFLLSLVGVWDLMTDASSPCPSQKGFLIFQETKIIAVIERNEDMRRGVEGTYTVEGNRIILTDLFIDTAPERGALGDGEFEIDGDTLTITWLSTNPTYQTPHHGDKCRRRSSITGARVTYDADARRWDGAPWCNRLSCCRGVTMAHDTAQQVTADPVPVTLLVGFLGSGKTTLANRILSEQHDQRIAVIVNEFGDVGIDGRLIVGVDDNVIELSNGCLCCTVQGDLADTLRQLLVRRRQTVDAKPFARIVIEASGLASPGPVLQRMLVDPSLHAQVHVDGVVTMVHAKHIVQQLADHPEASEQVAYADHIIVNHCDQCEGDALAAAEAAIHACNPHAAIERATRAAVDVVRVLNTQTWDSARVKAALEHGVLCSDHAHDHDHAHLHTQGVGTLALRAEAPMDLPRLTKWLLALSTRRSHELMRLKGILNCQSHDQAVVIQGVYQWLEVRKEAGEPPAASALVLIGRHLDEAEIRRAWADCIAST